jgi:hypothetical protein
MFIILFYWSKDLFFFFFFFFFFYQVLRFFPTYLCTLVLGMLLISLLHTVLDGGPRKWSYEEPSKPMTYQHTYYTVYSVH